MRPSGRQKNEIRKIELTSGWAKHAEGSCLVKFGDTHVICTASVEERVPFWMRNTGKGWVTAEYGMLPRSTHERMDREAARGKQSGRTLEIQRLIARALRAVIDLEKLGEIQIKVDCDVLQADGGTRTASITGAWVALFKACQHLQEKGKLTEMPINDHVAAISCGIVKNESIADLDYDEDSHAEADCNFILTAKGGIVEVQGTAEADPFSDEQFFELMKMAKEACSQIVTLQRKAIMDVKSS